jgi:hypothetical protein
MAVRLASSVTASESITIKVDGKTIDVTTVASLGFVKQSDGSWLYTSTSTGASQCADAPGTGAHSMSIVDASGRILAQGSYSTTP